MASPAGNFDVDSIYQNFDVIEMLKNVGKFQRQTSDIDSTFKFWYSNWGQHFLLDVEKLKKALKNQYWICDVESTLKNQLCPLEIYWDHKPVNVSKGITLICSIETLSLLVAHIILHRLQFLSRDPVRNGITHSCWPVTLPWDPLHS